MPSHKLWVWGAMCLALTCVSCSRDNSKDIRTFPMGERVQRGPFIYTVFETQWMTQLGEGNSARIPQNRYFLVRLSITNSGSADAIPPNLTLVNDKGETIPELSNGEGVPMWMGFLRSIKPAESVAGNIVFDATPRRYKLRVSDESEEHVALIDLPLTFGAETPEMPSPGEAKKSPAAAAPRRYARARVEA